MDQPSVQPPQEQLARQGEALEALEKTYGIWQSFKRNKRVVVYSIALDQLCSGHQLTSLQHWPPTHVLQFMAMIQLPIRLPWLFHPLIFISAVMMPSKIPYTCLPYGPRCGHL